MTTPCSGCRYLRYISRGTIPRTICTRYRKPALAKCLDYREVPPSLKESFDRILFKELSGMDPAP